MNDEHDIHFNKNPRKTYVSPSIVTPGGGRIRIASKVFDSEEAHHLVLHNDDLVIRTTHGGRQQIIAKFTEDERKLFILTFQKFNRGVPHSEFHFSFRGKEINLILEFLLNIKKLRFPDDEKINISDDDLRKILLSDDQARRIVADNEELIISIAKNDITTADIVSLGYRRKQLERYDALLNDKAYFDVEQERLGVSPEGVWQSFFDSNKWIFGYGLSLVFLTSLDGKKLEQVVQGYDLVAAGKRADGLMKTQALINALCFVEIKRHTTELLNQSKYRSGVWHPSAELVGGVAQSQGTVLAAVENLTGRVDVTDREGNPTGEILFNIEPKSFLVIGSLAEFQTPNGVNESRYRSFELFRRNLRRPEIITFDELFHRAKFIVEHR